MRFEYLIDVSLVVESYFISVPWCVGLWFFLGRISILSHRLVICYISFQELDVFLILILNQYTFSEGIEVKKSMSCVWDLCVRPWESISCTPNFRNTILTGSSGILKPCGIYRWYSSGSKEDRSHIRVAKVDNSHGSEMFSEFNRLLREIYEGIFFSK